MKSRHAGALATVCLLLVLASCGTPTIRAYSGAARSQDQVAILTVEVKSIFGVQPVLDSLDGKVMHKGLERVNMRVEMEPGPHRASVRFFESKVAGLDCSAKDKQVDFVAEPGHTYLLQATVQVGYPCFLGGTRFWQPAIVDITPKQ